jgi:predicted amidohydrolase
MVTIAAAQFGAGTDKAANLEKMRSLAETARERGAAITCFPELCTTPYFCWESNPAHFELAESIPGPSTEAIAEIASATGQTIVCGLYEKAGPAEYYNSATMIDRAGKLIGLYRKNSIPLSVNREGLITANEKMYFKPGNLGFPAFPTDLGVTSGIMVCYDRHFPEAARILGLGGADVVFIPTASWRAPMKENWILELRAHAFANGYYVCGVNKVGREPGGSPDNHYFGTSVIVDPQGKIIAQAGDQEDEVIVADIDLDLLAEHRRLWPIFRDRRPDAYAPITR